MAKTKVIKIDPDIPETKKIEEAVKILKKGGLVAFPTETVYGIAAAYNNASAIERLYKVKNRPKNKPFTIHISRVEMIEKFGCETSPLVKTLIGRFWPGPLTVVLKMKDKKKTLAFRMPEGAIAIELIERIGIPVVAPSANISGGKSPETAEDVLRDLDGKIDIVIDGGPTKIGIDSTIVDATSFPYRILREGAIPSTSIKDTWPVRQ